MVSGGNWAIELPAESGVVSQLLSADCPVGDHYFTACSISSWRSRRAGGQQLGLCCAHCQGTVPFSFPSLPFGRDSQASDLSPDLWGRDLCHSVQEFSAYRKFPLVFSACSCVLQHLLRQMIRTHHEEWPELRYKISCRVLKSPHSGVILSLTFTPLVTVGRLFNPVLVSSSVHGKQG